MKKWLITFAVICTTLSAPLFAEQEVVAAQPVQTNESSPQKTHKACCKHKKKMKRKQLRGTKVHAQKRVQKKTSAEQQIDKETELNNH